MADTSFVLFTLGPVQNFIKAARTVRDLWSGSYLLSYLTFRAMKAVADAAGEQAIVFPDLAGLPLWQWERGTLPVDKKHTVLEPCIPNRFLAEVSGDEEAARKLADAATKACASAWKRIAEDVRAFLKQNTPNNGLDPYGLWDLQIKEFFEMYTAVLPASATDDQIQALLGTGDGKGWADRHQVAQKMLAAVKNRRHFPKYAPALAGDVPQKDTLLGTLEHMGPGNRQKANAFWEAVADKWTDRGSRVNDGEKLCAVSLVKRFAWAQHFSKLFSQNPRRLRFDDTSTVAAACWLSAGNALDPDEARDEHGDWNGTWLYRDKPDAPTNARGERIKDERPVPDAVWNAITEKQRTQGKPPTYYAVFVFDGDSMGDRFNAATSGQMYRVISRTLGTFALEKIRPIVERHGGQLIYAGGDDAICVLPTETALTCVREINDAFRDNWLAAFPEEKPATISGGLVVAHYKEDLRLVMEEAHKAEKRSKEAGRNRLTLTVCRRSGEHSSATLPWDFVPTVGEWVSKFSKRGDQPGASDRWAYKLRADLGVFGEDREMFRLELGRQLNRAEQTTRDRFPVAATLAEFDQHAGTITDFITLLQSASFLARGRDA